VELVLEMVRPNESCDLVFLAVSTCTSPTHTHGTQQVAEEKISDKYDHQTKVYQNMHQTGMQHQTHVKPLAYWDKELSQGDAA